MTLKRIKIVQPDGPVPSGALMKVYDDAGEPMTNVERVEFDVSRSVARVTLTLFAGFEYEGPAEIVEHRHTVPRVAKLTVREDNQDGDDSMG